MSKEQDKELDALRQDLGLKRFYTYGTIKIFEQRARCYKIKRDLLTFFGIIGPLTVGAVVAAFGLDASHEFLKNILLPLAGLVAVLQIGVALWSLVRRWDEGHLYATASIKIHTNLLAKIDSLLRSDLATIKTHIGDLRDEYTRQDADDMAQHISDKEKRFAMRHALFYYKKDCATCKAVPASLSPTNCDTCGNF
jgi:mobilome CxxCx(11)CxxC protein